MNKEKYTGVSLFTGAGGMDVGFEKAGVKVVFANEIMKEAAETYVNNHEPSVMVNDDINNIIERVCQGLFCCGKDESG